MEHQEPLRSDHGPLSHERVSPEPSRVMQKKMTPDGNRVGWKTGAENVGAITEKYETDIQPFRISLPEKFPEKPAGAVSLRRSYARQNEHFGQRS
jgi:hypothetical protein